MKKEKMREKKPVVRKTVVRKPVLRKPDDLGKTVSRVGFEEEAIVEFLGIAEEEVMVEACLDTELREIDQNGTKILDVSVCYYGLKDKEDKKYATCQFGYKQDGTVLCITKTSPTEVLYGLLFLFPEEMLVSYFKELE